MVWRLQAFVLKRFSGLCWRWFPGLLDFRHGSGFQRKWRANNLQAKRSLHCPRFLVKALIVFWILQVFGPFCGVLWKHEETPEFLLSQEPSGLLTGRVPHIESLAWIEAGPSVVLRDVAQFEGQEEVNPQDDRGWSDEHP